MPAGVAVTTARNVGCDLIDSRSFLEPLRCVACAAAVAVVFNEMGGIYGRARTFRAEQEGNVVVSGILRRIIPNHNGFTLLSVPSLR